MKLTKEETIQRHREMWGWLAENPMKDKLDWPGWGEYGDIDGDCFLCEYAFESKKNDFNGLSICDYCPVEFEEIKDYPKGTIGYCLGGLFSRWDRAIEPKERSRIASLIRDLPEKKEQSARKFKAAVNYSCCEIVVNQYDRKTIYNGPATICIINLEGKDYKGIARCAPDDTFNERFGQRLAEVRAFKAAFEDAERMLLGR